jgi:hypothetical protein
MSTGNPKPKKKPLHYAFAALERTGRRLKKLKPTVVGVGTLAARRVARRQATGLQFALADRIDFPNPVHWDTFAEQTVFLSRDYLRALEQHAPVNLRNRYAMACEAGR